MVKEEGLSSRVAVLGPAQRSAIGQPHRTMWRFGVVVIDAAIWRVHCFDDIAPASWAQSKV